MPSSYTTRYKWELPATGEQAGIWGNTVNNAITSLVEEAVNSAASIANGNANQTLTIQNGSSSANRATWKRFTGALTANRTVTLPDGDGVHMVENATTGGFSLLFKTSATGTVTVPAGFSAILNSIGATMSLPSFLMTNAQITSATIGTLNASFVDGSAATPSINFSSDTNTGIYRAGADQIGFATNGVNRVTITATQFN